MKNFCFPAVVIGAMFMIYGFAPFGSNTFGFYSPEDVFIQNEIIKDFRIPSQGYYPEFLRNLKMNPVNQDNKTGEQNIDQNWYSKIKENLKNEEYNISYSNDLNTYQSPNRANNFRFVYQKDGFSVSPRTTKLPLFDLNDKTIREEDKKYKTLKDWKIKFALTGYGREGYCNRFYGDNFITEKNSGYIEDGNMKITYHNNEKGMRQDFIIKSRPAGNSDKLVLKFRLDTKLKTIITPDGIKFLTRSNSQVMQYSYLYVTDANGKELHAKFQNVNSREYNIIVDDKDAVYPIKVDPLSSTPNWIAEGDQTSGLFGYSASTAGDVNGDGYSDVIIGAVLYDNGQTDEGKVFVYHGSASGLSATANWTVESNQTNPAFGCFVSTAGDVNGDGYSDVLIGAFKYDNGQWDEGLVFVYHGSASGLSATANSTVECNQDVAYFGHSASTAGDVNGDGYSDVIVGAYQYDGGETNEGKVFVYHGSSSGLSSTAIWTAECNQAGAFFGVMVSTAGDVNGDGYSDVIIGALNYDNGQSDEGKVFVYHGSVSGLSATADWMEESDQAGATFGNIVSTAGDVNGDGYSDVIVSAPSYDNGETNEGRAFVYHGSASGLSATADWTAESNQVSAVFGSYVSTAGDVNGDGYSDVIVGAAFYDNVETDEGKVFVYHGSSSGLSSTANWTAESDQADARFGDRVSTAGDVNGDGYSDVIIGVCYFDNTLTDGGRAFVYYGSASGLSATENWTGESNQAEARFGFSVSTAGDVNGDGYSDVIVGAPYFDNGLTDEGMAFVYHGSASGLSASSNWTAESNLTNARFGNSVSTAGDVNGDGYSDVIVGAYKFSNGQSSEGRAYVYHGSATGLSATANWTAESDQGAAFFGYSVSTAGDVNGDGYSDVIVGALEFNNGQYKEGRAFVYHGSATGLSATVNWTAECDQGYALFGNSVSTAGDVNGDGYSDVIVGAQEFYNGQYKEGRAFVYHGSATGLSATANWTAESNQESAFFGVIVSTAGDVNGDGYSDVIVGAYLYDNGQTDEGRVFVYHGSASGLSATANWTAESDQIAADFGYSVSSAGDVNGDGYSDIIIGARQFDNGQTEEGRVYVFHGSSSGLSASSNWTAESDQIAAIFGYSVSSAGDVNGDGYSDVIVGASYYDNGQTNEGRVYVYYGNGGTGIRSTVQQYKPGTSTIIPPLGLSGTNGSVRLSGFSKSPFGRADGKLVWEFKQNGQPFSGPYSTSYTGMQSGYTDISSTGQTLNSDIAGIPTMKEYKWRVRTKFSPVNNPYQVYGPWRYYTSYMPVPWGCFKAQDSPLPVELMSFTSTSDKNIVTLKWTTGKEINNKGFSVERYDNNKKGEWTDIGFIEGKGNSNNPVSYEFIDKNVIRSSYKYRLKQTDYNGNYKYHELQQDVVIGAPKKFELSQNYPNPFNPTTKITFAIPNDSRVTLKVYDISGREMKTLINGEVKTADWYTVEFSGAGLSSGVYFYRLTTDGINRYTAVKKMMLVK